MTTEHGVTTPWKCRGKYRVFVLNRHAATVELLSQALPMTVACSVAHSLIRNNVAALLSPDGRSWRQLERCAEERGITVFGAFEHPCDCGQCNGKGVQLFWPAPSGGPSACQPAAACAPVKSCTLSTDKGWPIAKLAHSAMAWLDHLARALLGLQ